jgi:hypothetical protein
MKLRRYSDEDVARAVANSKRWSDVYSYLNIRRSGGNFKTIQKIVNQLNLDTSHFIFIKNPKVNPKNILIENSPVSPNTLKKYLIKHNLIPYECVCGLSNEWENLPLVLQIEHTNGIHNDNRLENLKWLCPNCHSQTPTFRGRNNKKENKDISLTLKSKDRPEKRRVNYDEVEKLFAIEQNYTNVGKTFGISGNMVKKILKKKGISRHLEPTIKLKCPICEKIFERVKSRTHLLKNNSTYTFCSKTCCGIYGKKKQLGILTNDIKLALTENIINT